MKIVSYHPKYRDAFIKLNTEWLTKLYYIESFDQYSMDHVDELIENGAMAFFAVDDADEVMATCMTEPIGDDVWEICKLAAVGQYTGTGAGSAVLKACMDYSVEHGAKNCVLLPFPDLNRQFICIKNSALLKFRTEKMFGIRKKPMSKWNISLGLQKRDRKMRIVDRESAEHYNWKNVCDGWHFLNTDELSIIAEKMPPNTFEDIHFHYKARQFFYVLFGEAEMRFQDKTVRLQAGSGIEIEPMEIHQMANVSCEPVEFMVISTPKAHGDKEIVTLKNDIL